jgi:hypothetical protein
MKILLISLVMISSMNTYSQSSNEGGIVGGYVDESKQSPELKEQIRKFREEGKLGAGPAGSQGGIAGGAVSGGGIAGGYIDESKQSPELKEQIRKFREQGQLGVSEGYAGGIAGGAVGGGIAGGFIDSNLANCKKEDDGKTISCPDGEYIKNSSTNNSLRFPIKDIESKKEVQVKKPKSATKQ